MMESESWSAVGVTQPVRGYRYIGSGKRATRALLIRLRHYLPLIVPEATKGVLARSKLSNREGQARLWEIRAANLCFSFRLRGSRKLEVAS
jgi:hypothetical protein